MLVRLDSRAATDSPFLGTGSDDIQIPFRQLTGCCTRVGMVLLTANIDMSSAVKNFNEVWEQNFDESLKYLLISWKMNLSTTIANPVLCQFYLVVGKFRLRIIQCFAWTVLCWDINRLKSFISNNYFFDLRLMLLLIGILIYKLIAIVK